MKTLIWFRKDLRIADNPALVQAIAAGAERAIYIATPEQWQQHNMAPIQADFIQRHLNSLALELAELGITLTLLQVDDFAGVPSLLKQYCHTHGIERIVANSEPEFNEQRRDQQVTETGVRLQLYEADVCVPKGQLFSGKGTMYKVFTPFKRAWLNHIRRYGVSLDVCPSMSTGHKIHVNTAIQLPYNRSDSSHWPLARQYRQTILDRFIGQEVLEYNQLKDYPHQAATAKLSPYLAIGAISVRSVLQQLLAEHPTLIDSDQHPAMGWLNELIWRDFYRHLLVAYPQLSRNQSFRALNDRRQWPNDIEHYQAWCQAKTGYPLVDAAMRQLLQTGWMHNRLRMVVASFLIKHLLVDWRWGEAFFSRHLIDGDLAANNGGWQWSAGTGCDAQPFTRIFNPIIQSQKFDPDGDFIRQYMPELAAIPAPHIHFPHPYIAALNPASQCDYWLPVVEHKAARTRALAFYQQLKSGLSSPQLG